MHIQLDILPNAKNIHVILSLRCRVFKHDLPVLGLRYKNTPIH